ncbi:hypothetical protein BS47DRAFT_77150 [Hydnum rufescens UP504]|uniref:Uncharacterized protein n=1 Tax=Hydnum rufescens UP504 TaxID=1448309 RepID=A0A9P6B7Y6_9AGAM|nr:hypothetical protein BS47DRAFT_77150 [Hydnum rufescens UP504]
MEVRLKICAKEMPENGTCGLATQPREVCGNTNSKLSSGARGLHTKDSEGVETARTLLPLRFVASQRPRCPLGGGCPPSSPSHPVRGGFLLAPSCESHALAHSRAGCRVLTCQIALWQFSHPRTSRDLGWISRLTLSEDMQMDFTRGFQLTFGMGFGLLYQNTYPVTRLVVSRPEL